MSSLLPASGSDLVWGDAPPTVPGWYWVRGGVQDKARIVRLYDAGVETGARVLCLADGLLLSSYPAQSWAGPIPEPRETSI